MGLTRTPTASQAQRPTSLLHLTNAPVAEWEQIPATRLQIWNGVLNKHKWGEMLSTYIWSHLILGQKKMRMHKLDVFIEAGSSTRGLKSHSQH